MNCYTCSRPNNSRLPFYCRTCALTHIYPHRLEHARTLLQKDDLGRKIADLSHHGVTNVGEGRPQGNDIESLGQAAAEIAIQEVRLKTAQSVARVQDIQSHVKILRREIEENRAEIRLRRSVLAQRLSYAESVNFKVNERRETALAGVQNSTKRTDHLWHALHTKTAESRIFLCREAASLYGLSQKVRKRRDRVIESYIIGGVPIPNLCDMNGISPAQLTTALSNVARLLVLTSHYLSLRLPAEVTLPHSNHPTATIMTPFASYLSRDTVSDRSSPQSASAGPTTSRTLDPRQNSRPRPLYIDKPLPKLMKEDTASYALFVEGTALLAWNASWLCRTQGLNTGSETWEDVCNIGKNMWLLLVAPHSQNLTIKRAFAGLDLQQKYKGSRDSPKTIIQRTKSFPMFGHYSHGTSHSFLGGAEGTDFMKTWKLASPTTVADKLRSALVGEIANAEWELLEEREWDDSPRDQPLDSTALGGMSKSPEPVLEHAQLHLAEDRSATKPQLGDDSSKFEMRSQSDQSTSGRAKGTSGWTKIKSK